MISAISIILAAGEGKRMNSGYSKVVHKACGKALLDWVCDAVDNAGINEKIVVVGHKEEQVRECMGDKVKYVVQRELLGTGHAVIQAKEYLEGNEGLVLVLCGDTPLITSKTLSKAIEIHKTSNNSVTAITARVENPFGYGRILRNDIGDVVGIVEQKDATEKQKEINEINSGMYCFDIKEMIDALGELKNDNSQGEYYLTDTLEIILKKGKKVGAYIVSDVDEILGINDRMQLAQASEILRKRIVAEHMKKGVTFIDPATTYIDKDVKIGKDSIIYPSSIIEGKTILGEECTIGPSSRIMSSEIKNKVEIINSVVMESYIDDGAHIGPFAYVRPESRIGKNVKVGDFVEIKKSNIGDNTKISHLTYVGDADIGNNVNLGCGVVVVNYDGKKKHRTIVGDNAFVGCNTNLVSPVEVEKNSYIAAGSTITKNVPENSLAIARARQEIKEEWVSRKGIVSKPKE